MRGTFFNTGMEGWWGGSLLEGHNWVGCEGGWKTGSRVGPALHPDLGRREGPGRRAHAVCLGGACTRARGQEVGRGTRRVARAVALGVWRVRVPGTQGVPYPFFQGLAHGLACAILPSRARAACACRVWERSDTFKRAVACTVVRGHRAHMHAAPGVHHPGADVRAQWWAALLCHRVGASRRNGQHFLTRAPLFFVARAERAAPGCAPCAHGVCSSGVWPCVAPWATGSRRWWANTGSIQWCWRLLDLLFGRLWRTVLPCLAGRGRMCVHRPGLW